VETIEENGFEELVRDRREMPMRRTPGLSREDRKDLEFQGMLENAVRWSLELTEIGKRDLDQEIR
jgi:hypothetical protein